MPKTNPLIVTPPEADIAAPHPQWLQDLKDPNADLWVVMDALAARVAALEGHS